MAVATSLAAVTTLLSLGHYASVAWPAVASHPEIARPLRLDRPDSFGRWFTCVTRIVAAGAALLIYQLRRYRIDDYEGHYRLWRIVLLVMLVASLDAVVSITDWLGAVLDMTLGQRVAMRGADWLRLLVTFGGTVLAMRLVAEVRRCRWSLATMIAAWGVMAVPVGHAWNLFSAKTPLGWSLVTAAPLIADTLLLISLGGYLRSLYREVRRIEDGESLVTRVRQFPERLLNFTRRRDQGVGGQPSLKPRREKDAVPAEPPRRRASPASNPKVATTKSSSSGRTGARGTESESAAADEPRSPARGGWLRRRKARQSTAEPKRPRGKTDDAAPGSAADGPESGPAESPGKEKKRRRFSLRLTPPTPDRPAENSDETAEGHADTRPDADPGAAEPGDGKRRRFRFPWKRRRSADVDPDTEPDAEAAVSSERKRPQGEAGGVLHRNAGESSDDRPDVDESDLEVDQSLDPDEIDWSSLSKSARRRLRKQLKRQKRVA